MSGAPLEFEVLDPQDDSPENVERVAAWLQGTARGFHQRRFTPESQRLWLEHVRADSVVLRGAWLPEGAYAASAMPVATFASWAGELNTGSALLPLHLITDVTVSPAHRRQGLLRRLMVEDLRSAVAAGRPLAALMVSEGTIYGRFGFAPATWRASVEVDASRGFEIAGDASVASFAQVEPVEAWPTLRGIFERWHRGQRGSVARPQYYDAMLGGAWNWEDQAADDKTRGVVHLDETGEPDGYVLYRHEGWDPPYTVTVRDLVALSPQTHLELWRFLGQMDLCDRLRTIGLVQDPLTWALTDPRRRRVTKVEDHVWLRILDVPAALEGRPWYGEGRVVLDVRDPLGHAQGLWSVQASGGRATVTEAPEGAGEPELSLDVSTLSALYLGGVGVPQLVAAGRITGSPRALETWAAMSDGGPQPLSLASF